MKINNFFFFKEVLETEKKKTEQSEYLSSGCEVEELQTRR